MSFFNSVSMNPLVTTNSTSFYLVLSKYFLTVSLNIRTHIVRDFSGHL